MDIVLIFQGLASGIFSCFAVSPFGSLLGFSCAFRPAYFRFERMPFDIVPFKLKSRVVLLSHFTEPNNLSRLSLGRKGDISVGLIFFFFSFLIFKFRPSFLFCFFINPCRLCIHTLKLFSNYVLFALFLLRAPAPLFPKPQSLYSVVSHR